MGSSKHVHCEVIKAWAEGAEIQIRADPTHPWMDVGNRPQWYEAYEYRVKPEPKPDIVCERVIAKPLAFFPSAIMDNVRDFVKCTYDRETGALKSVEMINGKQ